MKPIDTISITKQELMMLLEETYQEGFSGYLDLKYSYCKSKLDKLFLQREDKESYSTSNWAITTSPYLSNESSINGVFISSYSTNSSIDLSSNEGHITFS